MKEMQQLGEASRDMYPFKCAETEAARRNTTQEAGQLSICR